MKDSDGTTASSVSLPADAANCSNLAVRFIMTSNISSRAGTGTYLADDAVASGGTSNINNISIQGTKTGSQPSSSIAPVTATPSVTPGANNSVPSGTTVSLACATAGVTIHYSLNNSSTDQIYNAGTPIVLNDTTTIKAYAVLDADHSDTYTFTYTVNSPAAAGTIAAARAQGSGSATVTGVVTRVTGNNSLYIQDSTGGICVYGGSYTSASYPSGTPVSVSGTVLNYNSSGLMELTSPTVTKTGGTLAPRTPAVVSLSDFSTGFASYEGQLIQIKGATLSVSGTKYSLTSGSVTVPLYPKNSAPITAANGSTVDVTGIATIYSGNAELYFCDANDMTVTGSGTPGEDNSGQVASVQVKPGSGAVVKVGDSITLSTTTSGASIKYKLNGASSYSDYGGPITIDSLPLTVSAYAVKSGLTDSVKTTVTYDAPNDGNYNIYFGQLHSHTNISDGQGSVTDAFTHASGVSNLDFLAVTDHSNYFEDATTATAHTNTILDGSASASWKAGRQAAAEITASQVSKNNVTDPNTKFLGIYGYEMTWSDGSGHINTFNTQGFEDRQNPYYDNKAQSAGNPSGLHKYYDTLTTVPQSASQFNHPGTTFGDFYDFADYSPAYDSLMDMVEVGNGEGPIRGAGYFPSYEYYTRALDKGWHVAPTNNQDNHKGNWGDSNTARSVILAKGLSENSLYDAMKQRRMYATEDNDLSIQYTLNGNVMGSVLTVPSGDPIDLKATISDPSDKSIGNVQVIVNGGRVAAQQTISSNSGTVEFKLNNNYTYYYLRVTQPDADIAVTAPVWTNDVNKAGIASTTADTALPVKGEACTVTSALYNNDQLPLHLESLQYSVGGQVIKTVSGSELNGGQDIQSLGTAQYQFSYTPPAAGDQTINATLTASENGVEHTYTSVLQVSVADPKTVTRVLIDGTHYNNYVTGGSYPANMNNITQIAASEGAEVKIAAKASDITPDILKKTQLLVISSPATTSGTSKSGVPYTASTFSSDFISMVNDYVAGGGTVIVCGTSDYSDGTATENKASTQINALLQGVHASAHIRADEMLDDVSNSGATENYHVFLQGFNTASPLLNGVVPAQKYSFYSGCSVDPGSGLKLVYGNDSTYAQVSYKSDPNKGKTTVSKGGQPVVLSEETIGKGRVFTAGSVFLSDFEIQAAKDNNWDLPYANYNIMDNLLDSVKVDIPVDSIADVRKNGQEGDVFAVQGTVTAGSEQPNAFTDTLYIQDSTGGIDLYPIANGSGIKVGQKVRVVGHVSSYQGDKELKIGSGVEGYQVVDSSINPLSPTALSTKDAMNYDANGGSLVSVTGKVSNIQQNGGLLQSFTLSDGSSTGGARIFINGYISPSVDLSSVVKEGNNVTAVGVVYNDPDGTCLRVRDRNEIKLISASNSGDNPNSNSGTNNSNGGSTYSEIGDTGVVIAQPTTKSEPSITMSTQQAQQLRDTVVASSLTDAERAAVNAGAPLKITVSTSLVQAPTQADQQLVQQFIQQQGNNLQAAEYLNIDISLQVGDLAARSLTELGKPITLVIQLPPELQRSDRVYYVVRIHDGQTTLLKDQDSDPATVTIVSDRFSVYALAYGQKQAVNPSTGTAHTDAADASFLVLSLIPPGLVLSRTLRRRHLAR